MANENVVSRDSSAQNFEQRRKYSRHQFIERVYISRKDGTREPATSFEISAGGMSVATTAKLKIGEEVALSPVSGERVVATVRRSQGTMFGLEFLGASDELRAKILQHCEKLPLFRSMANI